MCPERQPGSSRDPAACPEPRPGLQSRGRRRSAANPPRLCQRPNMVSVTRARWWRPRSPGGPAVTKLDSQPRLRRTSCRLEQRWMPACRAFHGRWLAARPSTVPRCDAPWPRLSDEGDGCRRNTPTTISHDSQPQSREGERRDSKKGGPGPMDDARLCYGFMA